MNDAQHVFRAAAVAPEDAARGLVGPGTPAHELGELFAAAGHELYLVGGSVRDAILGLDPPDLDFATSARPDDTRAVLRGWADDVWDTGARFGTISARKGERHIEITTYRADRYTPGSRHPEVDFGDDITADLSRRDFTINAIAVDVRNGALLDPFDGLRDLRQRTLRTPIEPEVSFGDDPLRMVRLARFTSVLEAEPEPATADAARRMAPQLETISAERVRDELSKLLVGAAPARGLDLLVRCGLAPSVVPELLSLRECRDPQHRHKDVYAHTLAVVENCAPDLELRLAGLLHDVGKPDTREIHPDGTVTFHHHEVVGARIAKARLQALRYDRHVVQNVSELVRLHLRFHTYRMGWTDSAVRRYVRDAGAQLDALNALTRADVTTANKAKAGRIAKRMSELEARIADLREREELERLRPALDGNRIMEHLGIPPGRDVGEAWNHLLELRIEQGPMSEDEARAALDAWWAQRTP